MKAPFCKGLLLAGLLAHLPLHAAPEAGRLLFTLGEVQIERGGTRYTAGKGASVEVGDTVHTGALGRTQLRMNDGGLIALRPVSSFLVEDYTPPVAAPVAVSAAPGTAAAPVQAAVPGRALMRLLRGGFRAISGLIGKSTRDEYRVNTPVATIGIRGTDYSATYCNGDCGKSPNGLHVGVSSGRVFVSNNSGDLNLDDDQYGYVPGAGSPPEYGLEKDEALETVIQPSAEGEADDEEQKTPPPNDTQPPPDESAPATESAAAEPEKEAPVLADKPQPADPNQRSTAFVAGPLAGFNSFNGASAQASSGTATDANGNLTRFGGAHPQGVVVYAIGTASNRNNGFDSDSELRWGRWTAGVATVSQGSQDGALNLSSRSLHWIVGPVSSEPVVLPISGSMNYVLVGNTDPTDLNGARGVLGAADFSADFTNQTVSSSLALAIGGQAWNASGTASLVDGSHLFAGSYSSLTVGGQTASRNFSQFTGFFTPEARGAGLSYSLDNGSNAVYGVAAFGATTSTQPGP